ncbi:MAG: efflux RND transporter periplasmic adaptor subunit, partial [Candidatus Omnitrophica bacterium]|nr:efflux RND transporter periplasmic adaptor subunit [Candidatus Omnitrophota bacterium]
NLLSDTSLSLPASGENVSAYISVYEYEIGLIKIGDKAILESVAYPGTKFDGKIIAISPVLDPITRTNQIRVEVPNIENKLKPEMYVNAAIEVSLGEKLSVPQTAVIDTGLRKIVYVTSGEDEIEQKEVILGQSGDNSFEVIGGLEEGDIVITSGNFLIDSEARLKSYTGEGNTQHSH